VSSCLCYFTQLPPSSCAVEKSLAWCLYSHQSHSLEAKTSILTIIDIGHYYEPIPTSKTQDEVGELRTPHAHFVNTQLTTSQFTNNIAALGAFATAVAASNPIVVKGQDFIDSVTDKRFMVLGVDYQEGGAGADFSQSDPLTNATRCLRDAALMQNIGVVCSLHYRPTRPDH
jgi:hypothetical protein